MVQNLIDNSLGKTGMDTDTQNHFNAGHFNIWQKSNTGSVSDAFRHQCFDTIGWVSGRASGL